MNENHFAQFWVSQVAVWWQGDRFLTLEFSDVPGGWGLPGGRIDHGEEREAAFRREIREELGIVDFRIVGMADVCMWIREDGQHICALVYLIDSDRYDAVQLSHEHSQLRWVTFDEARTLPFVWPDALRMVESAWKMRNNV